MGLMGRSLGLWTAVFELPPLVFSIYGGVEFRVFSLCSSSSRCLLRGWIEEERKEGKDWEVSISSGRDQHTFGA